MEKWTGRKGKSIYSIDDHSCLLGPLMFYWHVCQLEWQGFSVKEGPHVQRHAAPLPPSQSLRHLTVYSAPHLGKRPWLSECRLFSSVLTSLICLLTFVVRRCSGVSTTEVNLSFDFSYFFLYLIYIMEERTVTFKNKGLKEISWDTRVGAGIMVDSALNPLIKLVFVCSTTLLLSDSFQYTSSTRKWTGSQRLGDWAKGMCGVHLRGGVEPSLDWHPNILYYIVVFHAQLKQMFIIVSVYDF